MYCLALASSTTFPLGLSSLIVTLSACEVFGSVSSTESFFLWCFFLPPSLSLVLLFFLLIKSASLATNDLTNSLVGESGFDSDTILPHLFLAFGSFVLE